MSDYCAPVLATGSDEICVCVNLRYAKHVPAGTDVWEWLDKHKDEIIGSMRLLLDSDGCRFVFADDWGDLIDYDIYCD